MSNENIFGSDQDLNKQSSDKQPVDAATLLLEIKNERGEQKYRSVEDALNALKHSQEFIPKLKSDLVHKDEALEQLQEKVKKIEELEATLQKLTQREQESRTKAPSFDEESIEKLVEQKLTQTQLRAQQEQNLKKVTEVITSKFGKENAAKVFYEKAQALGFSQDEVNELAANKPQAVLTWFGISEDAAHKQAFKSPSASKVNTAAYMGEPQSFIGRETEKIPLGATLYDYKRLTQNAEEMVKELNEQGLNIHDIAANPKLFRQIFK